MKSTLIDYLADLNREQRRAVEHGVTAKAGEDERPLLVIAGAGSGKTKTLAYRVAHLIVNGVDPHRILLLTFSRRAAAEMKSRVDRITAAALDIGKVDLQIEAKPLHNPESHTPSFAAHHSSSGSAREALRS